MRSAKNFKKLSDPSYLMMIKRSIPQLKTFQKDSANPLVLIL